MKTHEEARQLAEALVAGAKANGRRATAVLTDMSQPLGRTVGNALEVVEAIRTMTPGSDGVDAQFRELCIGLTAEGLRLTGLAKGQEAIAHATGELDRGGALTVFREIVAAQGGDVSYVDNSGRFPIAPVVQPVTATSNGWVETIDTEELGNVVVSLGGGRATKEDTIDPAVGLVIHAPIGKRVQAGDPLVEVHARTTEDVKRVAGRIREAYRLSSGEVFPPPLFIGSCSTETR